MLPKPDRSEGCLSDFALDLLVAGDASPEAEGAARSHLATCAECTARHAIYSKAQAAEAPRPEGKKARIWPRVVAGATIALSIAAAFTLAVVGPSDIEQDTRRGKGGEHSIAFFVKRGELVVRGSEMGALQPGDQLRFSYSATERAYLTIISVDGAGVVSRYFPESSLPEELEPAREVPLPLATELDDTLGRERIYAFFCEDAIASEELERRASATRVTAPDGCDLETLDFVKEAAP